MPGTFTRAHSFRRGCLGKDGRILLLLVNDEIAQEGAAHTGVVLWDNGRFRPVVTTAWTACTAVFLDWPDAEFAVIGEQGQLLKVRADGSLVEDLLPICASSGLCLWKGAAVIDGRLFAVGTGFCCAMVGPDDERLDLSAQHLGVPADGLGLGFEAVAGTSHADIVAVGWDGAIWCFDGRQWEIQDSPVNLILSDVIGLADGTFWACGQEGTVVKGRRGAWRALETGLSKNLWSLALYQDAVIATSTLELFRFGFEGDEPQSIGLDSDPRTFYWLDAKRGEVLLSTGAKDVVLVTPQREFVID